MTGTDRPIVRTHNGDLRGTWEDGLAVFRGVPYAAAPMGDLRWRAAQPHPGWPGVRDAASYGPGCPQPYAPAPDSVLGRHGEPPFDEDCLTLNVWTPDPGGKNPVLVWIHGGGFVSGSGTMPVYAGDTFARDGDLVVVTINYRLGPLGYLYLGEDEGNFWLTDQLAALRWVQDTIAAFGGDPARVTVAGQSGGAFSTAALACHPEGGALFHRMILQSPPFGLALPDRAASLERTRRFAAAAGAVGLDELRTLPSERLVAAAVAMFGGLARFGHWPVPFLPMIDGVTLERHPADALADGHLGGSNGKETLIGWTANEATFAFALNPAYANATVEEVLGRFTDTFGDQAERAYSAYAANHPNASPGELLTELIGDDLFRVPASKAVQGLADKGRRVWAYQFDYRTPAHNGRLGATHCLELPFTFNNADRWTHSPFLDGAAPEDLSTLGRAMHTAWINFVRTGDPQVPGWSPVTPAAAPHLRFDTAMASTGDPVAHLRELRDEL
ncbi:MAG TPA: carboxylesterase family protein [Spirillospora sp.]|nr:carboxylesterase family protein [Spirillospora sp.]